MDGFEFCSPTKFVLRKDADLEVGKMVRKYSDNVLFVHYGDSFTYKSGLYDRVTGALKSEGLQVFELPGVEPNPKLELVKQGIELVKSNRIKFIVAAGGGSVIDTAKAVGIGSCYEGDVWDFYTGKAVPEKSIPVGVIMTMPATGSEASNGSVIKNGDLSRDVMGDVLRPVFALMNPNLTLGIPKKQTVNGIVDMFSHVMERYFSLSRDVELTDCMCEGVMRSIVGNARKLFDGNMKNPKIRAEFMFTSIVAHNGVLGVGRSQEWTTHALAAQISAKYNVVHGQAIAVLYPVWAEYVLNKSNEERFARFAAEVFGVKYDYANPMLTAIEGVRQLRCFFDFLAAPKSLRELGVPETETFEDIADKVCANGHIGWICPLERSDVIHIYERAL